MSSDPIVFTVFLIFTGAAVMGALALWARQALIVSYIVAGILLGPAGAELVTDPKLVSELSHIGIIFLLFLLGLNLHPQKLVALFRETAPVTGLSSLLFFCAGFGVALLFGFSIVECIVIGAAMMFSSTIIGLKLLPTTVLHHQRTGEIIISILLLQDLIAVVVLLGIRLTATGAETDWAFMRLVLALPVLGVAAWLGERFIIIPLIRRYDTIQEFIFLVAIGWCLGFAEFAAFMGLSAEVGAFIAGVAIATNRIALFISDSLRPLRDFFLVMFFFALGASFDLVPLAGALPAAAALAATQLLIKPHLFKAMLKRSPDTEPLAGEIGLRLGQISEFSLLVALLALEVGLVSQDASYSVQLAVLLSFIVSPFLIIRRYPTPMATSERLRRD